ncbi:TrkA-N:Sodium/hydrogen exchanger [Rubellimicrobium mesophilum DSM 19309]|uniref:TrkA-N:Sodium/hydrogen exchanger n=1 Tax=Rubellimicrobium mesophilum DSM 19309 TaxID=442562 RepID=A0A017HNI4_9RHOB|nr:cation:proton antiporter [Rubellimicrobium mesophilum]EYD75880.1 TrkA-N:Sodium/hydrogen exchanger [Rubellimicrobium mesophilum DSM 19309]
MHDGHGLITTLVAGFVLAFVLGLAANRLRLSPLVGYILAGVLVGPSTPGFVADADLAPQLADIGVILLMFGVGLHFSPAELLSVRHLALPGALGQIALATLLGWGLGRLLGLPQAESAMMGFSVSVASTVVLARALEERHQLKTPTGRLMVGWLVAEDLVMVLALVLLPLAAGRGEGAALAEVGLVLLKVAAFLTLMYFVGARLLPLALVALAHQRSRELFTLGVLAIALGIAWLAYFVFDASFALGAFVAGLVLAASPLGHAAAERSLPLRDAFAVMFFVAVGMQFDPSVLIGRPGAVLGLLLVVLAAATLAGIAVAGAFRLGRAAAANIAASIGQAGEFSFILAALGVSLGLLQRSTHDVILAAALLSIALNPLLFALADRLAPKPRPA